MVPVECRHRHRLIDFNEPVDISFKRTSVDTALKIQVKVKAFIELMHLLV
jgi:hypothetical protein